jgi:hypothetical protein
MIFLRCRGSFGFRLCYNFSPVLLINPSFFVHDFLIAMLHTAGAKQAKLGWTVPAVGIFGSSSFCRGGTVARREKKGGAVLGLLALVLVLGSPSIAVSMVLDLTSLSSAGGYCM